MSPVTPRQSLGRRGEELAADFLRRHGFRIRETNVRSRLGEIDIIADAPGDREEPPLVFIEVKTRRSSVYGSPVEAVGTAKQRRLTRLAAAYRQTAPAHPPGRSLPPAAPRTWPAGLPLRRDRDSHRPPGRGQHRTHPGSVLTVCG